MVNQVIVLCDFSLDNIRTQSIQYVPYRWFAHDFWVCPKHPVFLLIRLPSSDSFCSHPSPVSLWTVWQGKALKTKLLQLKLFFFIVSRTWSFSLSIAIISLFSLAAFVYWSFKLWCCWCTSLSSSFKCFLLRSLSTLSKTKQLDLNNRYHNLWQTVYPTIRLFLSLINDKISCWLCFKLSLSSTIFSLSIRIRSS